ncbi:MAG: DUF1566 domain-containing protein [Rhodoferax sp.]|nr:DUF1566 domain-containing protein [Rhodoferax sp.]
MQSTSNLFKALLFACLLLLVAPFAQAALTINTDGTVTDPKTGLTWMRCAMGLTLTGSTCTGTASTYTYDQANALTGTVTFAGQSDWRLPNIRELQTILDRSVYPAIDNAAFPNTPSSSFWSGSPYAGDSNSAWDVHFGYGFAYYDTNRSNDYAVRLVRGGQSFGPLLGITRPTSDYVDNSNGTVTHTPTNLTWKRCAQGQTWTGSTCSGTATSTYTFDQANELTGTITFAGQSDWRVPTQDELVSLVDYSIAYPGPTINSSVFPATPPDSPFWSGSPYAVDSKLALYVYFNDGYASNNFRSTNGAVRLVRGGQSVITATPVCTLSANPPTISAGSSSTLTATCNPSASSYTWTGGTCAGTTGATCTVAPSAATSYTVTGINTVGNGNTAGVMVRIAGNTTPYTIPGTLDDDVFVLTAGNSYFGGGGNDTYIISPHTLRGAVTAKIIDTEGTNIVQLANGMTIASSSFFNNAVQIMLSNGAIVQVLGASSFIYQLGANASSGEVAGNLNFAQFSAALGANVPAAGAAAVSGTANFVVQH